MKIYKNYIFTENFVVFLDIVNGDLKSVILFLSGLKNFVEKVSFVFQVPHWSEVELFHKIWTSQKCSVDD